MVYHYGGARGASAAKREAKQRIIDAAIELYAEHGLGAVTLKQIAALAEVSAPLVIHHFGSTSGLRTACDQEAARRIYAYKTMAVAMGEQFTFEAMLRQSAAHRPLLRYLTQALMAGGEEVDALMDQLVDDAVAYTTDAVEQGLVRPSPNERHRAAMLLLQGLGAMMLHRQMKRLIGTSPMDDPPEEWGPYILTVFDIYAHGVFTPGAYDHALSQITAPSEAPSAPPQTSQRGPDS